MQEVHIFYSLLFALPLIKHGDKWKRNTGATPQVPIGMSYIGESPEAYRSDDASA